MGELRLDDLGRSDGSEHSQSGDAHSTYDNHYENSYKDKNEKKYRNQYENNSADVRALLSYEKSYPCPACGSGQLSAIALMDVFACDFCRHMFTANLQTQSVQLADSLYPFAWRWQDSRWRRAHQGKTSASLIWAFCGGLMWVPVTIIALSNYIFPPLEGSSFPGVWMGLTWSSHSLIALWLLCEYHRWPWYVSMGIRWQRLRERFASDEA